MIDMWGTWWLKCDSNMGRSHVQPLHLTSNPVCARKIDRCTGATILPHPPSPSVPVSFSLSHTHKHCYTICTCTDSNKNTKELWCWWELREYLHTHGFFMQRLVSVFLITTMHWTRSSFPHGTRQSCCSFPALSPPCLPACLPKGALQHPFQLVNQPPSSSSKQKKKKKLSHHQCHSTQ